MNNIFIITTYTIGWVIVLGISFMVVSSLMQYISTGLKSTKALVGLVIVVALWLAAVIGLVLAQAHLIDLTKKNVLFFFVFLIVFDYFLIYVTNQWMIANVKQRIQRILRWMITGVVVVYALFIISAFIFVRS